jgi:hypothetical protein
MIRARIPKSKAAIFITSAAAGASKVSREQKKFYFAAGVRRFDGSVCVFFYGLVYAAAVGSFFRLTSDAARRPARKSWKRKHDDGSFRFERPLPIDGHKSCAAGRIQNQPASVAGLAFGFRFQFRSAQGISVWRGDSRNETGGRETMAATAGDKPDVSHFCRGGLAERTA